MTQNYQQLISLPTDLSIRDFFHFQLISSPFAFMVLYFPPPASCYILLVYYLFGKRGNDMQLIPLRPNNILLPTAETWFSILFTIIVELVPAAIKGSKRNYCLET